ncbi:MAG: hypothetical protein L6U99_06570 [Clostridium sp.]|nr:MAG: hypothetical protein L6U99_06570 [Clostridium sp.]
MAEEETNDTLSRVLLDASAHMKKMAIIVAIIKKITKKQRKVLIFSLKK